MVQKIFNVDLEELKAWMSGAPKQVAVPPPPTPATKTFILTMPRRDVVVLPAETFSNVREV